MFKTKINKSKRAFSLYLNNEKLTSPKDQQQQHPRKPTTGFVLIRTHQAGIVARNRCCDRNQAVSNDYACLMSSNKDETGRRLSRKPLLLIVR